MPLVTSQKKEGDENSSGLSLLREKSSSFALILGLSVPLLDLQAAGTHSIVKDSGTNANALVESAQNSASLPHIDPPSPTPLTSSKTNTDDGDLAYERATNALQKLHVDLAEVQKIYPAVTNLRDRFHTSTHDEEARCLKSQLADTNFPRSATISQLSALVTKITTDENALAKYLELERSLRALKEKLRGLDQYTSDTNKIVALSHMARVAEQRIKRGAPDASDFIIEAKKQADDIVRHREIVYCLEGSMLGLSLGALFLYVKSKLKRVNESRAWLTEALGVSERGSRPLVKDLLPLVDQAESIKYRFGDRAFESEEFAKALSVLQRCALHLSAEEQLQQESREVLQDRSILGTLRRFFSARQYRSFASALEGFSSRSNEWPKKGAVVINGRDVSEALRAPAVVPAHCSVNTDSLTASAPLLTRSELLLEEYTDAVNKFSFQLAQGLAALKCLQRSPYNPDALRLADIGRKEIESLSRRFAAQRDNLSNTLQLKEFVDAVYHITLTAQLVDHCKSVIVPDSKNIVLALSGARVQPRWIEESSRKLLSRSLKNFEFVIAELSKRESPILNDHRRYRNELKSRLNAFEEERARLAHSVNWAESFLFRLREAAKEQQCAKDRLQRISDRIAAACGVSSAGNGNVEEGSPARFLRYSIRGMGRAAFHFSNGAEEKAEDALATSSEWRTKAESAALENEKLAYALHDTHAAQQRLMLKLSNELTSLRGRLEIDAEDEDSTRAYYLLGIDQYLTQAKDIDVQEHVSRGDFDTVITHVKQRGVLLERAARELDSAMRSSFAIAHEG